MQAGRALMVGLALAAGCATADPEQRAREALLWDAAQQCKTRFGTVLTIDRIDHYGVVWYTCAGSCPEATAFDACMQEHLQRATATGPAADRLSASARRATRATVPVTERRGMLLVTATVNGQAGTLLLDTGASVTTLSPTFAKRAGVAPPFTAPQRIVHVAGGGTITMPVVRLPSVALGEMAVEHLSAGVFDVIPHERDVDGVLGSDYLRHFTISLDQAAGRLTLEVRAPPP